MAKPFSIQSPEDIAKEYAGNKQKIAQAMQLGIVDPTAGVLAGMFIDRMRAAQMQEMAPQTTVAQQVMGGAPTPPAAPQSSAGGLGALSPAAPPMALGAPQAQASAGLSAQPVGMAMGGAVNNDVFSAPYMGDGGLASLSVPDSLFDEPTNGGYAGGGLVAFAAGDAVEEDEYEYSDAPGQLVESDLIEVTGAKKAPKPRTKYFEQTPDFRVPEMLGGFKNTLYDNLMTYGEAAPRETKRAEEYAAFLDRMRSPEEQKKRRQEDMWMALGQIGAKMASTPGSLLQAASAGIGEALPGVAAAAKERRAEERAAMQALVAEERASNKEITERADKALDMLKNYGSLSEAMKTRAFQNLWENMGSADRRYVAQVAAAAGIQQSQIGAGAQVAVGRLGYNERRGAIAQELAANFDKNAIMDKTYSDLLQTDPGAAAEYRNKAIFGTLDRIMPALGSDNKDPAGIR